MLHRNLHPPPGIARRAPDEPIIETLDIASRNNLSQAAILRIPHLDEILIEQEDKAADHGRRARAPDKLHDDAPRDVTVLVDVHGALLVHEQELRLAEPEHAERLLALQPLGNHLHVARFQIRDADGLLLIQGEDLEAALGGDGEAGVEDIDAHALGGNVKLVEVPEELGLAAANLREAALLLRRLLEHGLEDL